MEKQKELLEHLKQNHTRRDKVVCSSGRGYHNYAEHFNSGSF